MGLVVLFPQLSTLKQGVNIKQVCVFEGLVMRTVIIKSLLKYDNTKEYPWILSSANNIQKKNEIGGTLCSCYRTARDKERNPVSKKRDLHVATSHSA